MRTGAGALLGVFLFTLLMIGREGMETALLLLQLRQTLDLVAGAAGGRRRRRRSWRGCGRATATA